MGKILIFHTGTLGDTLVILDLLGKLRQRFAADRLYFCCNPGIGISPCHRQLLEGTGIVDEFFDYPATGNKYFRLLKFFLKCRKTGFDTVVDLRRQGRGNRRIFRQDRWLFRACGIRRIFGTVPVPDGELSGMRGVEITAERLYREGVLASTEVGVGDLRLTGAEKVKAAEWFASLGLTADAIPVVVGIGGKQQVCRWPMERYVHVLSELTGKYPVVPLFFGGSGDAEKIRSILRELNTGISALESGLSLRECVAAMKFCRCYLGNDTGTIHMAAAAGLPCIGIFSSHDTPGYWTPLGAGHIILQTSVECGGCRRAQCYSDPAECIAAIREPEVINAVKKVLQL